MRKFWKTTRRSRFAFLCPMGYQGTVPGTRSSLKCTLVETAYHAIEEVDEVARATG